MYKKIFDLGVAILVTLSMIIKFIVEKSFELYDVNTNKKPNKKYKKSSNAFQSFSKHKNNNSFSSKPKKSYKKTAEYKEKQKIKAKIDSLYIELNELYNEVSKISHEIDELYSNWRSSGVKTYHGDSDEAKEMYSLKDKRDAFHSDIKDIKSEISSLKAQKNRG